MASATRLHQELHMLATDPPPGVCAWPVGDAINHLRAQIQGPDETPYEKGIFELDVSVPDRYPMEPPKVRFITPIFHPNVDSEGRICLDTLKMQPAGSWTPACNIPTLMTTIRTLMAHPNGDDGLMPDITAMFNNHPAQFDETARAHTKKNAIDQPKASVSTAGIVAVPSAAGNCSSSSSSTAATTVAAPAASTVDVTKAQESADSDGSDDDDSSDGSGDSSGGEEEQQHTAAPAAKKARTS